VGCSAGPDVISSEATSFMHNSATQYGSVARFLHWAIAILIIVTLPCAWVMTNSGPGPLQNFLFVVHESIGLTVLALAILRVIWRLVEPPPPLPASVPPGQALLAHLNHWLLYLLLFLMPVSGYLSVVAGGYPLNFFGLFDVPRLVAKSDGLGKFTETAHFTLQYAVYALVLVHVAAALHHHWARHDGVLRRMWPARHAPAAE
jgi:cytochrome b561